MKTPIRFALCGLVFLVPVGTIVRAADPVPPPLKGTVLILENEHTLEGDIERIGQEYRIRRDTSETWVSGTKVLRLCKDGPDAYAYLRSHANLDDADERYRLAQWCFQHGLPREALAEVKVALEMRPRHGPSRWLLARLQENNTSESAAASSRPGDAADVSTPPPSIDLNTESLAQFVTRVQPILMNTCVSCHGALYTGPFKLVRVHEGAAASRKALQQNMAAVLAQINFDKPSMSNLLIKAVTAHGEMTQPQFKNQEAPAYRSLDDWVQRMVATHPQLRERGSRSSVVASARPETPEKIGFAGQTIAPARVAPPKEPFGTAHPPVTADRSRVQEAPRELAPATAVGNRTTPVDEFDPLPFNRQMHPQTIK